MSTTNISLQIAKTPIISIFETKRIELNCLTRWKHSTSWKFYFSITNDFQYKKIDCFSWKTSFSWSILSLQESQTSKKHLVFFIGKSCSMMIVCQRGWKLIIFCFILETQTNFPWKKCQILFILALNRNTSTRNTFLSIIFLHIVPSTRFWYSEIMQKLHNFVFFLDIQGHLSPKQLARSLGTRSQFTILY